MAATLAAAIILTVSRETVETSTSPLSALEEMSAAVQSGAGLPELVRAAARALETSLVVLAPSGAVLAVAARSSADERVLVTGAGETDTEELTVAGELVGRLRLRARDPSPPPAVISLAKTLMAAEVRRLRAPERASEQAAAAFLGALLRRELPDREQIVARGHELGVDLGSGGSLLVVRPHPLVPTEDGWRERVLTVAERGARAGAPGGAVAAPAEALQATAGEVVVLVPGDDPSTGRRAAEGLLRELEANLHGFAFAVGRSRVAEDPTDLARAGHEALLAANVADAGASSAVLGFEETGAYRLLLPAMSQDPAELQRFYAETLEPLVAYDDQYETDLVRTVETFLESDGNVAGTAQKLYTHRHTVRYRLERVRDLSGLDVGSTDGREKLSLGLKAMRVLGIAAPRGPATEAGAQGGRVPGGRSGKR